MHLMTEQHIWSGGLQNERLATMLSSNQWLNPMAGGLGLPSIAVETYQQQQ